MARSLPKYYKAAIVEGPGLPLELIELEQKQPGPGQVMVKVLLAAGQFGTHHFPCVPGHDIVGDVVAVDEGVARVFVGQRVGGAWHGGHDNTCRQYYAGLFQLCWNGTANGVSQDGGYGEYVVLRSEAVVRIPKDIDPALVAPLLYAGITSQEALSPFKGLGGLGPLDVQDASKMGYKVIVLSPSADKEDFARELGAHDFIDTSAKDAVKCLQQLGGASLILVTAPNPKAISPLTGGLRAGEKLCVLAPVGPVELNSVGLISKAVSVHGWPGGHAVDCEDAIEFAREHDVRCVVERFGLKDVEKAMKHMLDNTVRFRSVLLMDLQ
ncbi:alcohol dehydrogenase-like domain-containing protein [Colletotrichum truncatum]|uniref:Alcohol dehydrogenase-like domain-containing protein n=1 Tax=Colletotrichum truncatum TaxID=5467 RepID=A0ACC3YNZ2_COLTU